MSRYIDAERIKLLMKQDRLLQGNCEYELWKQEVDRQVNAMPYIDLADYVPKDFHDKTCEAMAKAHQEEIADMVRVADRPQGEWIEVDDDSISCRCSVCGWEAHLYEDDVYGMPYCPNCGAKMKGADDE